MKQMTVTIASVPDRDNLVAELWCKNELWGELSQQQGQLKLEIYPTTNGEAWKLIYEEVINVIQEAKDKLLERDKQSASSHIPHDAVVPYPKQSRIAQ
jgi:phage pi2 protein 07